MQSVAEQCDTLEAADLLADLTAPENLVENLLSQLQGKPKKRVVVREDFILEDCYTCYKNTNFDPTIGLQ